MPNLASRMPDFFGDRDRPHWVPDGGLLGPRHPAWGQARTSGLEDRGVAQRKSEILRICLVTRQAWIELMATVLCRVPSWPRCYR